MRVKLITILAVCILFVSIGSVSHAELLLSGGYGLGTYEQSIREYRLDPTTTTVTQGDWALAVGVSFVASPWEVTYYPTIQPLIQTFQDWNCH